MFPSIVNVLNRSQGTSLDKEISLLTAKKAWCHYYETEKLVTAEQAIVDKAAAKLAQVRACTYDIYDGLFRELSSFYFILFEF
jgi:hypothetical protein